MTVCSFRSTRACPDLGVPVFLMSGPTSPYLEYTDPVAGRPCCRGFPHLQIVCYHGF